MKCIFIFSVALLFSMAQSLAATVERAQKGPALVLSDGQTVRLLGVYTPSFLEKTATQVLAQAAQGLEIAPFSDTTPRDRYGAVLAVVPDPAGVPLQTTLLRQGQAVVFCTQAGVTAAQWAAWYGDEALAREKSVGLWARFAVRAAGEAVPVGDFQIVRGTVTGAKKVRDQVYLNFGADWKTDFTVEISKKDARTFKAQGLDPETLSGKEVEVRGWVTSYNGPTMTLSCPANLRVF